MGDLIFPAPFLSRGFRTTDRCCEALLSQGLRDPLNVSAMVKSKRLTMAAKVFIALQKFELSLKVARAPPARLIRS